MTDHFRNPEVAREWMILERKKRGWSTTDLADEARAIARREGSEMKLAQQSISDFEQAGKRKRMPEWMRFVRMAFEEGASPRSQDTAPREELAFIRQVDIAFAMGDGTALQDYPETNLVPFNLHFLQAMSRAPLERMFLATGVGESMEPTLLRSDLVLVDTTQQRVAQQDMIWALEYAGGGMIKRLRRVRSGGEDRLLILSDNPAVPSQEADLEDVRIIGKVIWVGRRM